MIRMVKWLICIGFILYLVSSLIYNEFMLLISMVIYTLCIVIFTIEAKTNKN